MEVLLTSYCDWTEYTLYLLAAEQADAVERYHLWADDPQAPAHLHTDPPQHLGLATRVAGEPGAAVHLRGPGLFAVVQSNSGLAPSEIAAVAENHFAVRSIRTGGPIRQGPRAKLRERSRVATRIVAQGVYRLRRALGRRKRRSPHSAGAAPVAGGSGPGGERSSEEIEPGLAGVPAVDDRDAACQQLITG